mgnify:CR=1 FL=1
MNVEIFKWYSFLTLFIVIVVFLSNLLYIIRQDLVISDDDEDTERESNDHEHRGELVHFDHSKKDLYRKVALTPSLSACEKFPKFCSKNDYNIIDYTSINTAINICDNPYGFSCGHSSEEESILSQIPRYTQAVIYELIEEKSQDHYLKNFYNSCSSPPTELLKSVDFLKRLESLIDRSHDLLSLWGRLQLFDVPTPIMLHFEPDPKNKSKYISVISHTYYAISKFKDEWKFTVTEKETIRVVEEQLKAILQMHAFSPDQDVLSFFSQENTNRYFAPSWPVHLLPFLKGACDSNILLCPQWIQQVQGTPVWMQAPSLVSQFSQILSAFPLSTWKVYSKYLLFRHLSDECYDYFHLFDIYKSLPWQKRSREIDCGETNSRQTLCMKRTKDFFYEDLYAEFYRREIGQSQLNLFHQVHSVLNRSYASLIEHSQRLSREQKDFFKAQISSISVLLNDPLGSTNDSDLCDFHSSYLNAVFCKRYASIVRNYQNFYTSEINFDDINTEASAFYRHSTHTIHIGVGMLLYPLMGDTYSMALARLGSILAHEMTHAIDRVGFKFSELGLYSSSILPSSSLQPTSYYNCLQGLYDQQHNDLTINENFADVVGFNVAYNAFIAFAEHPITKIEQSEFFIAFSQLYCEGNTFKMTSPTSHHSIGPLRSAFPLRNQPDFNNIWKCDPNLYKEKRCFLF